MAETGRHITSCCLLCSGLQPGLHWGGGRQKDVGKAHIHQEQLLPPSAPHCGGPAISAFIMCSYSLMGNSCHSCTLLLVYYIYIFWLCLLTSSWLYAVHSARKSAKCFCFLWLWEARSCPAWWVIRSLLLLQSGVKRTVLQYILWLMYKDPKNGTLSDTCLQSGIQTQGCQSHIEHGNNAAVREFTIK